MQNTMGTETRVHLDRDYHKGAPAVLVIVDRRREVAPLIGQREALTYWTATPPVIPQETE